MGRDLALEEVRNQLKPELINRIDEIVVFNNLSKDNLHDIVDINFILYKNRMMSNYGISIELHKTAKELFIEKGYDEKYGARELKRTIQRYFETSVAEILLQGKYKSGDNIICFCKDDELKYRRKSTRKKRQCS